MKIIKLRESLLNDEISLDNFRQNGICIDEFDIDIVSSFFHGLDITKTGDELFGNLPLPDELDYPEIELADLSVEQIDSIEKLLKQREKDEIKYAEIISLYGSGHWIDKNKYLKVETLLSDVNLSKFTNTICIIFMIHILFKKAYSLPMHKYKLNGYTELEYLSKKITDSKNKAEVKLYQSNKLIHRLNKYESKLLSEILNYFFIETERGQSLLRYGHKVDNENKIKEEKTKNLILKNKANEYNKWRSSFIKKIFESIAKSVPGVKARLVLIGRLLQIFGDIDGYDASWDKKYNDEEDYYYSVLRVLVKK